MRQTLQVSNGHYRATQIHLRYKWTDPMRNNRGNVKGPRYRIAKDKTGILNMTSLGNKTENFEIMERRGNQNNGTSRYKTQRTW